ncbi:hypothetical protein ACIQYF_16960, partial [Pseudomonas sp. NPDC096917]|uniref:hypothetical protein n=1 Tax=Pseudomonas sp. NPDC096917 TaxID=3364483 RepID=UPI003839DC24
ACNHADCAFFPNPLSPPEDRSEGVNPIQDGTTPTKKPRSDYSVAGLFYAPPLNNKSGSSNSD